MKHYFPHDLHNLIKHASYLSKKYKTTLRTECYVKQKM